MPLPCSEIDTELSSAPVRGSIGSDYIISDMLGHVIAQQAIRSDQQVMELPEAAEGVYTLAIKGASPLRFVIVR